MSVGTGKKSLGVVRMVEVCGQEVRRRCGRLEPLFIVGLEN